MTALVAIFATLIAAGFVGMLSDASFRARMLEPFRRWIGWERRNRE